MQQTRLSMINYYIKLSQVHNIYSAHAPKINIISNGLKTHEVVLSLSLDYLNHIINSIYLFVLSFMNIFIYKFL